MGNVLISMNVPNLDPAIVLPYAVIPRDLLPVLVPRAA
jgi:hypothetical protein